MDASPFLALTDAELTSELARLAAHERHATASFIASLGEFDYRRLYIPAGFSSLFAYCTERLHLAEGSAYRRIEAARTCRRFPMALGLIADGAITITALAVLARHLTEVNHVAILTRAIHKSKHDIEIIVAGLAPRPDVPTVVRKLPETRASRASSEMRAGPSGVCATHLLIPGATVAAPPALDVAADAWAPVRVEASSATWVERAAAARPVISPLTPERFKLQITMSRETHDALREIQDLIRHALPSGDAAEIVARALRLLRDDLLRRKAALVKRPRRRSADLIDAGDPVRAVRTVRTAHPVHPDRPVPPDRPAPPEHPVHAVNALCARDLVPAVHAVDAPDGFDAVDSPHGSDAVDAPGDEMDRPPPGRDIPADVKREVWMRDGARCAFVGTDGRCRSRTRLEFHHVHPFAAGGRAEAANIELRCRVHNGYEAEVFFGRRFEGADLRNCKGGAIEDKRNGDVNVTH